MSAPDPEVLPQTGRHEARWPGLVWAIPLAALLIVGYLGINAWANRGEVITVTFDRAADARPGDTKVLYQGVEAGHLIKIVPNEDGRRLDFKLRLDPAAKRGLNTNARFWLIGASPNLSDLSSLKAVVSGVAIGFAPGNGGTPASTFEGLDRAPVVLPGERGTRYRLTAHTLGSISEGSVVLFHGQPIGKVTDVQFDGAAGFRLQIFVFDPYDSLIKPGARFWKISPLRLSLAGGSISANLAPASTLLAGGIDVEVHTADPGAAQSKPDSEFPLYGSHGAARQGLSGPTVRYDFAFAGSAGDLDEDSAVTLLGFQIGEVEAAHLAYDQFGKPFTTVTALLYPQQLDVPDPAAVHGAVPSSADDWQIATDAKLRELLRFGYRARLQQTPALVGNLSIALVPVKGTTPVALTRTAFGNPRIPSAPGSTDLADITSQVDQIVSKVNGIPLERIGKNLEQITSRLNTLVSSPQTRQGLAHLNSSLAEIDRMLGEIRPQITPLVAKLNEAAGELSGTARAAHQLLDGDGGAGDSLQETIRQLNDAARSVRTLADYLGRHPDALLRGKRPDK